MKSALVVEPDLSEQHRITQVLHSLWPDIQSGFARSVEEAHALLDNFMPGLLITEFHLPDGCGLELLEKARSCYPDSHRIIFTQHDDDTHILAAIRRGIDGYILKDHGDSTISRLIAGVAQGHPGISPEVMRQVLRQFERQHHRSTETAGKNREMAEAIGLTPREIEVLSLLSQGSDRHQVSNALDIKASTVAGHIKSIYLKLNVSTRAEATLAAVRLGLVGIDE